MSSASSSPRSAGSGPSTRCCATSWGTRSSFPCRLRSGPAKGDLEWRRPTRETLQNMLRNPAYAGYYAYGRRQVDPRRKIPGPPGHRAGGEARGRVAGACCRDGCRPTSPRRSTGRTSRGWTPTGRPRSRRARRGTGRRCCPGCCAAACAAGTAWRSATTTRSARAAYGYTCAFYPVNYGTGDPCQHIAGPALDAYVARPGPGRGRARGAGGLDGRRRAGRGRAGRAGQAVAAARRARPLRRGPGPPPVPARRPREPARHPAAGGRLGGRSRRGRPAGGRVPAVRRADTPPSWPPAERDAIRSLAADLPAVWDAPTTTRADRKELLRILIDDVTVAVEGDSEIVNVDITWAGGHQTSGKAVRPVGQAGPALVLPRAPRPRRRARRRGTQQQADRRHAERRRVPAAQAHRGLHRPAGPQHHRQARNPRERQGPPRRPDGPEPGRVVRPGPVRRARHAHRQHLQLDLPRLDHRPPRPRRQELDHPRRPAAASRAPRAQEPPARLLHPRPLGTAPAGNRENARRRTKGAAVKSESRLTGSSGGRLPPASGFPLW